MPEVCVSNWRTVIGRCGWAGRRTENGSTPSMSSSKANSPSSTACITAVEITVFDTDASMNRVSRRTG